VFLAIHGSISKTLDDHFLIHAIVLIETVLDPLKNLPVVGVVPGHAFGDALDEVEKTKLANDGSPKDELKKVEELWEGAAENNKWLATWTTGTLFNHMSSLVNGSAVDKHTQ
jgi:hypothetical protein